MQVTTIKVTYSKINTSLVDLESPDATLTGTVVSWNPVANATGYVIGLFSSADATTPIEVYETSETSYAINYTPQGTYYVKVLTVGDNISYASSKYSDSIGSFSNTEIEKLTIEEFLAKSVETTTNKTYYQITGTLTSVVNSSYGNIYVEDNTGSVYVYGLTATKQQSNDNSYESLGLNVDDTITIVGYRNEHNSTAQVGGAYFVSKESNYCANFEGLKTLSTLKASYNITEEKYDGYDVTSETVTFSELGYSNATDITTVNGTNVTLTFAAGTNENNSPKYYDTGAGARMYVGNTLTIASESRIASIKFTFHSSYSFSAPTVSNGTYSNGSISFEYADNLKSLTITSDKTVRIQTITVEFYDEEPKELTREVYDITSASLRFGIQGITAELYNGLLEKGSNVTFGVAYIKATTLGSSTFEEAITNELVTYKECTPALNGETYQFALVLTGIPAVDFDEEVTAAAYVCVDGTYYYAAETTYSVNTIATEYVTNQTSNAMVQEHLGMLTWLQTYVGE